jgi:predicted Zn finger-like uncharacterized protein
VKISCPSCSAKYSISDEKVVSRLAKIRCRKCGSTIVIDGKVSPPHVSTSTGEAAEVQEPSETSGGGSEYSVDLGDGNQRTMPLGDIVAAYNAGQVTGETYVWADGFSDWKPLSDVQDIVDALHAAASGSRPAAASTSSPWDAKPAADPVPRAAARPARGGAGDLFGRIERAGSEDEVSTSAPEPAGLGGGGGAGTGARNESSVLFSLSALTSAAATSKPSTPSRAAAPSAPGNASRDDSGLIDLKALTAAAMKSDGGGSLGGVTAPPIVPLSPSPLGAPLGLGSPLGSPLGGVAGDLAPPQKSKTGLFIAIGLVAAALIVAVAFIMRPAPPPVVVAPPPAPTPAPAPTPTPTPTLAATPPATGSAAEEEAPADKKKVATTGARRPASGGGTKKASSKTESGSGDSAPAPAAAPMPKANMR